MGQSKKINDRLDDLLSLQRKHAQRARECPECGKRALSSKDVLGSVVLADPNTGQICPGCKAILEDVGAFYVVALPPKGVEAEEAEETA